MDNNPSDKSKKEKSEESIEIFKYFENANIRNRDAFCELLDYTSKNRKDPKDTHTTEYSGIH
jgi:hypothetical protein